MAKEQVKSFIDTIGHDDLAEFGFPARSIRKARTDGFFAARWYWPLKCLGESRGVFCAPEMFNWAAPAKQCGTKGGIVQGAETK